MMAERRLDAANDLSEIVNSNARIAEPANTLGIATAQIVPVEIVQRPCIGLASILPFGKLLLDIVTDVVAGLDSGFKREARANPHRELAACQGDQPDHFTGGGYGRWHRRLPRFAENRVHRTR